MRAMTQRVYVDDIEANDENIGTDCCPSSIDKPISGDFFCVGVKSLLTYSEPKLDGPISIPLS